MKKICNLWRRIPRPVRACLDVAVIIILLFAFYVSIGFPTITLKQQFRRAEKLNMVGPSQIVSQLHDAYRDADDLIVGETDESIIFFTRMKLGSGSSHPYSYQFCYQEKTGDITIAAAPCWNNSYLRGWSLPVYLFDDHPDAVRAELSVTVTGSETHNIDGNKIENAFSETFEGSARRQTEGHFYFLFTCEYTDYYNDGKDALQRLSVALNSPFYTREDALSTVITATVRLYDENDHCILERQMDLSTNP